MLLGWRGPNYADFSARAQLDLLWTYLTGSAASPLTKQLVESEEAACTGLFVEEKKYRLGSFVLWAEDVEFDAMETLPGRVDQILKAELANGIDLG